MSAVFHMFRISRSERQALAVLWLKDRPVLYYTYMVTATVLIFFTVAATLAPLVILLPWVLLSLKEIAIDAPLGALVLVDLVAAGVLALIFLLEDLRRDMGKVKRPHGTPK